ncbi:unnamed protein product [Ceutorhynchus assimilis]|uniref:Uncharacterized protein n=1 Tax=Ceutorhynchus assimilis TaxID=467358 RepID=A0A9N9MQ25_9CUCU|nr:unnamed protein product [Ceutorhynchus assimilis]
MAEVSTNVKDLIFAYERQTSSTESLEHYEGRRRAKSIGNALSYKLFRQSNLEIHHLIDIEKELVKIEAHLNYYEVYEKETQVAFQEQLLNVLTFIVNIDPEGDENYKQKKKDLIAETQKLFRILTSKLPVYRVQSYRSIHRTASRREEAIVSSTSARRGIASSQAFKSEESLDYSNKDSSSSVDLNTTEEKSQAATSPQITVTSETSFIPSVSKLKKFFSFRKDDLKVTPNSGVSRSQSLNTKANKYTVFKKREETLKENDVEGEFEKHEVLGSTHNNTNDENLYVEPVQEYKEIESEHAQSVSVSKLKSLFEVKQQETEEGLGSLTNKQPNEFHSDFNLPYTEANLGAFRLKRTISGHYMNFTGLLRNIDVQKKPDLNKSKSLSDLKHYKLKDDLSKEVDDDADGFERVGKEDDELDNNELHGASFGQQISEEIAIQSKETFVIGNVKTLKKTFENHNSSELVNGNKEIHRIIEPIQHQTDGEPVLKVPIQLRTGFGHSNQVVENDPNADNPNADIKHILHRTIDPIPNPDRRLQEPVLKVPIQLRTGFSHTSHSEEEVIEHKNGFIEEPILKIPVQLRGMGNLEDHAITQSNDKLVEETVTSGTVEALKQTFESRRLSLENSTRSEKPELRISEMVADFVHVSRSEKEIENGTVILHITIEPSVEEPVEVPTQINNDFVTGTVEALKQTFEHLSTKTEENSEEPVLKLPIQLRRFEIDSHHAEEDVGIFGISETINNKEETGSLNNSESITDTENKVEELNISTGTVEVLKRTFEHLGTTHEANSEYILNRSFESSGNSNEEAPSIENNSFEYQVTGPSEENSFVEQEINGGVMTILESPTMAYSTLLSSQSQQVSSSSKTSVSYSQKTSVQRTSSSYFSQKSEVSSSSSSSRLSSQKYFEVLKNSSSPREESTVTITEVEDQETPKYNLNISQENLIDEILKETDLYKNVDEEFEKLLDNTN